MKKLIISFLLLLLLMEVKSQVPQGINYQAVARNNSGAVIPAQNVNVRFSILDVTATGTILYQETHAATTNNFGLFTVVIGRGTPAIGAFIGINWASGTDKFIKVEIAPQGGSNYELQSTTQLLSVPYALYSEKTRLNAGNGISITNGNTIAGNYTAGSGININGSTISAIASSYSGGTGINIAGSTVSHALQAGTGININGATISGDYTGSNGVAVTGNNISGNYTAGPGININGSTISAVASSYVCRKRY
jgi:hypothetical protein